MTVYHNHHIIPKYKNGKDTPDNLVKVTLIQHAMFHFANWQLWNDERDKIAWQGLAGLSQHDECVARSGAFALTQPENREKARIARNKTFQDPNYVHPILGKTQPIKCRVEREKFGIERWRQIWFAIIESIETASHPKRWGRVKLEKRFGVSKTPLLLAYRKIQSGVSFQDFILGK